MSLDISLHETDQDGNESEVYTANITHNLNKMAASAGIYTAMWRPDELGYTKAGELIMSLQGGLEALQSQPDHYTTMNPSNGWGTYEGLVRVVSEYLEACKKYPSARIEIDR